VLVALDSMRRDPKGEELTFLVRAWKAAFGKAQSLGWLNWSKRRVMAEGDKILIRGVAAFLDISGDLPPRGPRAPRGSYLSGHSDRI